MADLQSTVESLWECRAELGPAASEPDAVDAVHQAVGLLDRGEARVAEWTVNGTVVVHEWLKKAILLLFRLSEIETVEAGPFEFADRIPLKHSFAASGVRVVPGASARWGSYL